MAAEINLRAELVDWLRERGHWVVVRSSLVARSGEVDTETGQIRIIGSGRADGRPYVDYLVKSDRRKVVPDYNIDTPVGDVAVGKDHFYFEQYVPVKKDDLVIEIELDTSGNPVVPVKIRQIWKIIDPEDMRDGALITAGRVEFFQCSVEKVNVP